MSNLRVLIFSASFGAGHVRAAEALIEELRIAEPDVELKHIDFGAFLGRTFNSVLKNTYIELIKHTPKLWGKFYYRTAKISPQSVFQRFLNGLGRRELLKYVLEYNPSVIICTYPTVAGVLAALRLKQVLHIPLVTVITDYAVHSQWINPGVDMYIVGCQNARQSLLQRGITPEKIFVTGIPVHPKFEKEIKREEAVAKLGLEPQKLTFLVMGGAYGVLEGAKRVCRILDNIEHPVQIIIVCGRDEKLYRSLDNVVRKAKNTIKRYGFVNNVEEFMSAADVIITKAGGLTVSEALTRRLPLLIYRPIPGQEEENAAFLEEIGAGMAVATEEELEAALRRLLYHPEVLEKMRQAAAQALPGKAAAQAVRHILTLADKNRTSGFER